MENKKYIIFDVDAVGTEQVWEKLSAFLKDLKVYGYHLAAVSMRSEEELKAMLKKVWADGFFDAIVGSDPEEDRVQKEDILQEALNRVFHYGRIDKKKVLMVAAPDAGTEKVLYGLEMLSGYGSIEALSGLLMDTELLTKRNEEEKKKIELSRQQQNQKLGGAAQTAGTAAKKSTFQNIWKFLFPYLMFLFVGEFFRQAIAYVLMFLAEQNEALLNFMFVIEESDEQRWAISGNGNALIQIFALLGVVLVLYKMAEGKACLKKGEKKELVFKAADWLKWLATALSLGLGFNMLFISAGVTTASTSYQETAANLYAVGIPLGVVLYGVVSPLAEEFLFRGIIFNEIKSFSKPIMAAMLSAVLFGVYHGNGVQLAYGTILGVVLAQAYQMSGRFIVPVVLHGVLNVLVFVAGSLGIFQQNAVQLLIGMVLTVLGLILFYILYRKDAYGTNH